MSAEKTLTDEAAVQTPEEAPSGTAADALSVPAPRRLIWLAPLAILIATAGLLVGNHRHDAHAAAGDEAVSVVSDHVKSLFSYSYQDVDKDLAAEKGWLTGPFADEYAEVVSTKIAPAAAKAKVTTVAEVVSTGLVSAKHDQVRLLLFVNVTTRSTELAEPRVSGSRLRVTADLVDGKWRISALDPV
jgi:Mce-associated membrane protein